MLDCLLRSQLNVCEEGLLHLVGQSQRVRVYKAIVNSECHKTRTLERHTLVGNTPFQELIVLHDFREVRQDVNLYRLVPVSNVTVAHIEEHPALRIRTIPIECGFLHFTAEGEVLVIVDQAVNLFNEAFCTDGVIAERGEAPTETDEELIRGQATHLDRFKFAVALNGLQGLRCHTVAAAAATSTADDDDSCFLHIPQPSVIADELDVCAADIAGEVFVIHQVIGCTLFQDTCQKDSALVIDMIALGDIV